MIPEENVKDLAEIGENLRSHPTTMPARAWTTCQDRDAAHTEADRGGGGGRAAAVPPAGSSEVERVTD